MIRSSGGRITSKIPHFSLVTRASSKATPGEQLLKPEWRFAESLIPIICCFVLPVVLGSTASYMHYSNPSWRERRGHAPASIRVANPPWPMPRPDK